MATTMQPQRAPIHQAAGDRLTRRFAQLTGKSESVAEKILYAHPPLSLLSGLAIRAYAEIGDLVGRQRFLNRQDEAAQTGQAPKLTEELELREQRADGRENETQTAYQFRPTDANAKARVLAIDTEMALLAEERAALVAKHRLET